MGELLLQGRPEIAITIRRSAQARRMTLRVSTLDGRVTLTVPRGIGQGEIDAFVTERTDWIRRHVARVAAPQTTGIGDEIPVLGEMRRIVAGSGRGVRLDDTTLAVPGSPEQVPRKLQAWLKATARSELAFASDQYAAKLGRSYSKLTLRDTRSRWGSCTSAGGLMYSWRLIMAPAEVLTYVAAHEVAHLQEMNHSAAFWSVVETLYGDYRAPRAWLRTDGQRLHAYQF
ncbi:MAG: SprT family zinc-dependent metalloprotease [Pseudomonadota bacterium]